MSAVDRAQVIAERDAQIIAWLGKKAAEYGTSNRESRAMAEAVARMADKLSRGAVRDDETGVSELYRLRAENNQLHNDITGACLARYEEEQENARLLKERHSTNEALDDAVRETAALRARVAELEAAAALVAEFCADRASYITSILNCHPDNAHDYHRWQGHAESRRQLSELLGLPVAWPAERQQEDPHDGPLHHDYALGRDLPAIPRQTTGRCPKGHTFEDCTCGGTR